MQAATYILFVMGLLGAADILLYHSISHGIRSHVDSRLELVTHSLRGPIYAALFVLVPNFTMQGAWFWVLMGILLADVGVSLADFLLERPSRAFFGGLPTGEYVLHIAMAMLFGALVTSLLFGAGAWAWMGTRLAYEPALVPSLLRAVMGVMAFFVLGTGALDALAVVRLGRTRPAIAALPTAEPGPK